MTTGGPTSTSGYYFFVWIEGYSTVVQHDEGMDIYSLEPIINSLYQRIYIQEDYDKQGNLFDIKTLSKNA